MCIAFYASDAKAIIARLLTEGYLDKLNQSLKPVLFYLKCLIHPKAHQLSQAFHIRTYSAPLLCRSGQLFRFYEVIIKVKNYIKLNRNVKISLCIQYNLNVDMMK